MAPSLHLGWLESVSGCWNYVAATSILDSSSSASRRGVRDFNLAGTGSVESTEKEVGDLVGSSVGTSAGVGKECFQTVASESVFSREIVYWCWGRFF